MASPVDADRVTTDGSTETTAQSLTLPGSISSGDILLAIVRSPASTTFSWPGGWTELVESSADASDDVESIAWRIADGTEGASITVTLGTARRMAGLCYRITGGDLVEISTVAVATGQPNSPTFTAGFSPDTRDVLWLSIGGCEGDRTLTSGPSGYSNATFFNHTGATGVSQCAVFGASLQATADVTEDPGAWTLDSNTNYMAFTVVVYTADPAARVSQAAIEAALGPTGAMGRISQAAIETAIGPTSGMARISQAATETIIDLGTARMRVSQAAVEVLIANPSRETFQAIIIIPSIGPP